jgi:DNA polymerase-1
VTASGIAPEVVAARGYYSVAEREEVQGFGFPRDLSRYLPALAIPMFPLRHLEPGESFAARGLILRPDTSYQFADGRSAKYLLARGAANVLDIHPLGREWLADVCAPLILTEGVIKADAAISVQLVAIGLNGVDGWSRHGAPLPEWELIPLKTRPTYICFDSDVTAKQSVRAALDRLVGYLQLRGACVEIVVLPAGAQGRKTGLDDFLAAHRDSKYPFSLLLEYAVEADDVPDRDDAPAPELPADLTGADVLDGLATLLERYIRFRSTEQVWAVALWSAATHFVGAFDIVPYLAVSSPTLRAGKSHLLDLVRWTCSHGRRMSGGSDAAIFRTLSAEPPPTLCFDEVDRYIGESTERSFLIGVLNEGFERDGVVARVEDNGGSTREVVDYRVYGMKCFTGIGTLLPATTMDRCIRVKLERRLRTERIAKWRARRVREQANGVRELLAGWAALAFDTVTQAYERDVEFAVGTNERAEDVWEALVAVAEAAGGEWPQRARQAALALTPADDDANEQTVRLLADIRHVFAEADWPAAIKSGALVQALNELEDSPWGGLRDGRGLSTHRLARELGMFDLTPERGELAGETVRGWRRHALEPIWDRYLPEFTDHGTNAKNSESPLSGFQSVGVSGSGDFPLNHAESDPDTSLRQDDVPEQSVGDESPANEHFPDTPTLSTAQRGETPNLAVVGEQLATSAEGISQTLELGKGRPLQAHLLPPDAAAETRERLGGFLRHVAALGKPLAVDVETTGRDPAGCVARLWSLSDGCEAWAIDARDEGARALLTHVLREYPHELVAHNIQFDLPVAARELELDVADLSERARRGRLVDTMILSRLRLADERRIGLKAIACKLYGAGAAEPERRLKLAFRRLRGGAERKWAQIDAAHPAYWGYACADAALTARLHSDLRERGAEELLQREMRVALICMRAGIRGWAVDPDAAVLLEQQLAAEQAALEQALRRNGITNIATTAGRQAIVTALEREGAELDGAGLDRSVLEPLALNGSIVARDVLALRTTTKFRSLYARMFLGATERDGRLHAFPHTLGATTGRMTLPDVPLQTLPRGELVLQSENGSVSAAVRGALVADEGSVVAGIDFEQMELRLAAALSGDWRLRQAVEQGDAHAAVASRLFRTETPSEKQRRAAKVVNFGVLYGMGGEGLARRLGISAEDAHRFVSRWWDAFPSVRTLRSRLAHEERHSLWGRRLPADVPEHMALNHVIQAYGRDVFAAGLLALEDAGLDEHLLLPLHDEYVLELPAGRSHELGAEIAGHVRSRLADVELPVDVTIGGRSWASVGAPTREARRAK